jgi:hypothetical protein
MAAVTIDRTVAPHDQSATLRRQIFTYTGPASYATGGDTGLAAALGWGTVMALGGSVISNGTLTYLVWLNPTTGAVMVFDMAGAQVANAVDLSTFTGRFEAIGR